MLRRKFGDGLKTRLCNPVRPDDESASTRYDGGIEQGSDFLRLPHVKELRLDAQGAGRRLDLFPLRREQRVAHVQQGRDSFDARKHLSEQLNPLPGKFGGKRAEPCDISAWS